MVKVVSYSESSIRQFYNGLVMKQKNGVQLEYEIRVDKETITPRSSELGRFFSFQDFISQNTESIEVWIYKGASHRYDKYVFELELKRVTQESEFQSRLEEALEKQHLEFHLKVLNDKLKDIKEKYRDVKERNKELKEHIKELESSKDNTQLIGTLMGILKSSNIPLVGKKPDGSQLFGTDSPIFNGIPNEDVLSVLKGIQEQLGDELFQTYLGTAFTLGQHPELIPEVRKLIEQHISKTNEDENEKRTRGDFTH